MLFAIYTESGQVVRYINAPASTIENSLLPGESYLEAENDRATYVDAGVLITPSEKPSPHHEWDWATKSWLPNLDAAKAAKKAEIESGLTNRLYLPCNGFDADKVSRERIGGMIARLQRGDGLPAGWMGWRDAENNMHWADLDAAGVLAELSALSRAIEDREQALLVASWTHKANIAALTDIDAIIAYDVTGNWPV